MFLDRLKIRTKLLTSFLIVGLVPLVAVTFIALHMAGNALFENEVAKFTAVQQVKRNHLENYFKQLQTDLKITRNDPFTLDALQSMRYIFKVNGNSAENETWKRMARKYDNRFREILADFGWTDLLLINLDGEIVYSVDRGAELGKPVVGEALKTTGLGKVYQSIQEADGKAMLIADFEPYAPAAGAHVAFIMAKLFGGTQDLEGFVAVRIASDSINAIIQQRNGLGDTGESYLVGRIDGKSGLRSDRVVKTGRVGDSKEDPFILSALSGASGADVKTGSTGVREFVRYDPVQIPGLNWAMVTTVTVDEVYAAITSLRNIMAGVIALVLVLVSVLALGVTRMLVKPIRKMVAMLKDIAEGEGDLTKRLDIKTQDELGETAHWFNTFMDKLQALIKEIAGNAGLLNNASTTLTGIASDMSTGAETMSGRSGSVVTAAESMSRNMNNVAQACEQAAANVNMVASATEEMSSTVGEIARNSEKARSVTESAVTQAGSTSTKVDELGRAAKEIGKVTETISEISEQTNLLALNATIEAARAGDAGKGFAVVANEIKELARQTAMATQDIKERIDSIQGSTAVTVTEIEQITHVIHQVNEIVGSIATAVEEQAVTTQEVAKNVNNASEGIQAVNENVSQSSTVAVDISNDIAEVSQSAGEISDSSGRVDVSARELSQLAAKLEDLVCKFKV